MRGSVISIGHMSKNDRPFSELRRQQVPVLQDALKYLDMCRDFTNHDITMALNGKSN
jgi:hypothetical protein